jgi:hypothetical protein
MLWVALVFAFIVALIWLIMSAAWMTQGAIGVVAGMLGMLLLPLMALLSALFGVVTFFVAQTLAKALYPAAMPAVASTVVLRSLAYGASDFLAEYLCEVETVQAPNWEVLGPNCQLIAGPDLFISSTEYGYAGQGLRHSL